jgi:O-antigen ligase
LYHSLLIENHKWVFSPHPKDFDYENFFYGLRFSEPVHPSYLAMYIIISVLILFEEILNDAHSIFQKGYYILIVILLIITLYLLSARAGMLAAIIVFPVYFLFRLYNHYAKWIVIVLMGVLGIFFVFFAVKNARVSSSIDNISNQKVEEIIKKDPRLFIWESAFGVIKKHPVLGVGTGDATSKLKEEFVARRYIEGYYDNLNVHNQFLEIWLENGIIGLLLFLSILAYMSYIAIKQKNILSGLFIITTIIFFIFETMMNRLGGVSFFALFSFLLIYSKEGPVAVPKA